ncbi:AAA family ATPase [Candidatus Micrarchaeota archaeon]|nr:AAA family ATPase [Candidatus Micrarchaeota archaeon]
MRIVITGTPGTGKTEVAKHLSSLLSFELISIKDFVLESHLGKEKDGEIEVGIPLLKRRLSEFIGPRKDFVLEGHLACEFTVPYDHIFVLRTHPETLRKRLLPRNYSEKKLNSNLMTEMLDYCYLTSILHYKDVGELDTSTSTAIETAQRIVKNIRDGAQLDSVNWSAELKDFVLNRTI